MTVVPLPPTYVAASGPAVSTSSPIDGSPSEVSTTTASLQVTAKSRACPCTYVAAAGTETLLTDGATPSIAMAFCAARDGAPPGAGSVSTASSPPASRIVAPPRVSAAIEA